MLDILHSPIRYEAAKKMLDSEGRLTVVVPISLEELYESHGNISDLFDQKILLDTCVMRYQFKAVGISDHGQTILMEVSGFPLHPDNF